MGKKWQNQTKLIIRFEGHSKPVIKKFGQMVFSHIDRIVNKIKSKTYGNSICVRHFNQLVIILDTKVSKQVLWSLYMVTMTVLISI